MIFLMEIGIFSGMLVQDPNKGNDVDAIFNRARQLGAVEGPLEVPRPSSSSTSFTGTGRVLSGDVVQSAPTPQQPQTVVHNIVFWRNGFTVNDGPLRRLDDPENAPFLEVMEIFNAADCIDQLSTFASSYLLLKFGILNIVIFVSLCFLIL